MTNIKLTLKDKLALILMKIVLKMGYTFYTRSFVDTPKINGDDIGIFVKERSPDYTQRLIAISGGGCAYRDIYDWEFLGKI